MTCELFVDRKFSGGSLAIIEQANTILNEYAKQNLVLTLRQLYYQFVARGLIPNKQTEYKRLGSVINDARLAGLVDWDMVEDRGRSLRELNTWDSPSDIVEACARQFRLDLWSDQKWRPEVWIEKDALLGVIEAPCNELRVPYFACRGYNSQSEAYKAGKRFERYREGGQTPIVFHFGDHDPSGIDMTRDNRDRLDLFSRADVDVRRLALTMKQIEQYNPPPNPAKETDSRSGGYLAKYGTESWELDALEPTVMGALVRDNVRPLIDGSKWKKQQKAEQDCRNTLSAISDRWDDVQEFLA